MSETLEMNFQSMKVGELRTLAIEAGLGDDEVTSMRKPALVEYLEQVALAIDQGQDNFNLVFEDEDEDDVAETLQDSLPKYGSPEWQEFVMAQFHDGEVFDGCPKSSALRRVAQDILGPVMSNSVKFIDVTNQDDRRAVTVAYEVQIAWSLDYVVGYGELANTGLYRTFTGIADCIENPECTYARHPAATAETKAMGRAFKNALCLNITTVEEKMSGYDESAMLYKAAESVESEPVDTIRPSHVKMLGNKCKRINMTIDDLINKIKTAEEYSDLFKNVSSVDKCNREHGEKLLKFFNETCQ